MINPSFFGASAVAGLYTQFRVLQFRDGVNYPLKSFWTDRPLSKIDSTHVYFFSPSLRRFNKSIVEGSFCAWVDFDTRDIPDFYVSPSLLLDTGHGFHAYWLFRDFCFPDQLSVILRDLVDYYKSDPKVRDVTRFMRWPESYNQKFSPPHFCSIVEVDQDKKYGFNDLIPS